MVGSLASANAMLLPSGSLIISVFTCGPDAIVLRWLDAWPGRLFPADTALVLFWNPGFDMMSAGRWETYGWDGDPNVEIRAIGPLKGQGYIWEARLTGFGLWPGQFRFRVLGRADFPEELAGRCPARPPSLGN